MKAIQVPMDDLLLKEITQKVKTDFKNRAAFIRTACQYFIRHLDETRDDQLYAEGYRQIPEDIDMAMVSSNIASNIMQKGEW